MRYPSEYRQRWLLIGTGGLLGVMLSAVALPAASPGQSAAAAATARTTSTPAADPADAGASLPASVPVAQSSSRPAAERAVPAGPAAVVTARGALAASTPATALATPAPSAAPPSTRSIAPSLTAIPLPAMPLPAVPLPAVPTAAMPLPAVPTAAMPTAATPGDTGAAPTAPPQAPRTTSTLAAPQSPTAVTGSASGTAASERYGWGDPVRVDDFTSGLGPDWGVYDGVGHDGQGVRSPGAVSVSDGVMTITGSSNGTTAGMAWGQGQKYGRWEARVAAPASDPSYHAVALLWPDAENWPVGGEVDFMEMSEADRQTTEMFLHYGADNSQLSSSVAVDATQWHNWAVEWTPDHIVAYVDGIEWFRSTDASTLPPGPMHLCLQLDWFPEGGAVRPSSMAVDWVRQYAL